jgi:putative NADH-flavin reductase
MQVTVLGGSGKIGRLVVAELLRRGHTVMALVHRHGLPERPHLTSVKGDVHDKASIQTVLEGSDAVISTLGSWGTKQKDVLSSAMSLVIPAMDTLGIRRIVTLTGSGATLPNEHAGPLEWLSNLPLRLAAPKILEDGEKHLAMLAESPLDWTVVRSPVMNNRDRSAYTLELNGGGLTISRQAVANALVDLAEHGEWPHQAPFVKQA